MKNKKYIKTFLKNLSNLFSTTNSIVKIHESKTSFDNGKKIVLVCNKKDILHLDSLTRYYESNYEGVLSRGIWLATLMRDSEVLNKNLAIVEIDKNTGKINSVSPVTIF